MTRPTPQPAGATDKIFGDSPVGRDLAAVDWAATALGPVEQWPQSLVSVVRVLLSSRFPMWMAWGPELTLMGNDAYKPILGAKYAQAMGRPTSEVWAEIWPDIGPRIERVMRTGEATWDEALLLFVERSGYREEAYFTFSYSPLADDRGDVVGLFCVVSEETQRVVGARHLATARDLGTRTTGARTRDEVLAAGAAQLGADPLSLPFTLSYLFDDEDDARAVLAASSGVAAGAEVAVPEVLGDDGPWPLGELLAGRTVVVEDLPARFAALPTGGWDTPPTTAVVVPLRQQGEGRPHGFLVAGMNPHRPLDDEHRGFVELLAAQLGAALSSARGYEEERERAERLAELDRSKTAFFTNVSHEFRTPLTLLLGPTEDALADTAHPLPEVHRARLELVQRNGERLLKMVGSLLDLSRAESGTLTAAYEPVDLAALTGELAGAFSSAVQRVGLTLTLDLPPLDEPAWVDREMWSKVVLNLLSNALKATFEGGITVSLRREGDDVRLDVTDTGTGIAPEQQPRLFERFVRVPGAVSRSHEGSGVGLALVAELAAAHGGSVAVDSAPGRGSTFTVRVPVGRDHLPAEQVLDAPVQDADASRSARGFLAEALRWLRGRSDAAEQPVAQDERPTVLVVDDNADMREHVARLLAPDHVVLTAEDGREGLRRALEHAPDLVLSDVMMPHLDGFGLLRALRADPRTAHTPVVLLSARAGEEATVEGLDAGADDYLVKPFSARELLARVRANLELESGRRVRRSLERSQDLLDQAQRLAGVGSFELDLDTGAVTPSEEFLRQVQMSADELAQDGLTRVLQERVHPDDVEMVREQVQAAVDGSHDIDYEVRVVTADGVTRTYRTRGIVERDEDGRALRVRGSNQDVTEQRLAQQSLADAQAAREVAAREHRIADELQRSLLPAVDVQPEALEVAAYYRAGAEGTQVGGDWYDVIELGAGRTALVLGDVMGRGVRAAAVMGQLRSAVRAYAGLDLPPADVLENLDGVVRFLGDDQIVTCVYAVYDPYDGTLTHANAGHLPPLVRAPDGTVRQLDTADGPPLGTGLGALGEQTVRLQPGDVVALYTDGLVERRDADLDAGIGELAGLLAGPVADLAAVPVALVEGLRPEGPDDDVAVLLARVEPPPSTGVLTRDVPDDLRAVRTARHEVRAALQEWSVEEDLQDSVLLLLSELVTNALVHGRPPVSVRLRLTARSLVLEVHDAASYLPRRRRPGPDEEHGRGLQLVSVLSERWGTRPTATGKAVWCVLPRGVA